ncbi:hypothetical protein Pla100_26630 [Neorhodopirellula pilleata]|uniref:Response regulatory domain-containing protein n=2 Tax=Neorhodopirellula pilleata TaxID=2714738 RepID=A0A5C6AD16_9BACT|nr:hypothetical protein Pla100_26630 [Neorhodopirellula pilleata]
MKPNATSQAAFKNGATVVVADAKPLSLLATAGVLHHGGMRCLCARTVDAVYKACGISPTTIFPSPEPLATPETNIQRMTNELIDLVDDAARGGIRVDEGDRGLPPTVNPTPVSGTPTGPMDADNRNIDLIVWDVGDDAPGVLDALAQIRQTHPDLPAILLAEYQWAGLEKKTESLSASTRCLFKPIDPSALLAVAEQLLWMPALQSIHRNRGSRPSRPGWVTL